MEQAKAEQFPFFEIVNLNEAWKQIRSKGSRGGIDGISIAEFNNDLDENLQALHEELKSNKYVPEPPERVEMLEFDGKSRPLGMHTIRDKVVQMAVKQAIEPIFNQMFLDCSYAYRMNKGHRKAIGRVEHYLRQRNLWITTCDIKSFFDSLDHDILLSLVKEKVTDPRVLRLIELWLKMGVVFRGAYKDIERGVIQGGVISPLLSNIYLHPFDVYMVSQGHNLVRYADDFVSLAEVKNKAELAFDNAKTFLENPLLLQLKPVEQKAIHIKQGFVFLGINFQGRRQSMADAKLEKAKHKITKIFDKGKNCNLSETIIDLNESIQSWRYYYGKGDVWQQFKQLENMIQLGLAELVKQKLLDKELVSKQKAQDILWRLDFLLPYKIPDKKRFIREILYTDVAAKQGMPVPQQIQQENQAVVTQQNESEAKVVPQKGEIKRAISRKKRKYQRLQASSFDLVIGSHGSFIGKRGNLVIAQKGGAIVKKISTFKLKQIVVLSNGVSISSDVIKLCARRGIPIDFLDFTGKPTARLSNPQFPMLQVGQFQLEAFHNGKAGVIAKAFVEGKVRNQLNLLKYFHKYRKRVDKKFNQEFTIEEQRIDEYLAELDELNHDMSLEQLRGKLLAIEGRVASSYWKIIGHILDEDIEFDGRVRKGASDLVNSMLNYGYGMLYSRVWGAVALAGLNPHISFLHTEQPGKPTLIFDLIEEFRPQCVDRVVVSIITKGEKVGMEGTLLDGETRNKLVKNVLERLNTATDFRGKDMSLANIIIQQARDLVKFLKGKKKSYQPYIGKW